MTNPLTGKPGVCAPVDTLPAPGSRPLPCVPESTLAHACVLCVDAEVHAGESTVITVLDHPFPLVESHRMVLWRRHVEYPAQVSHREWADFWDYALASPDACGYASFGPQSGGSQPHLHAHLIPSPPDTDTAESGIGRHPDACALCRGDLVSLGSRGSWHWGHVPGGANGEVVLYPQEHGKPGSGPDLVRATLLLWQVFAAAGWTSGTLAWHHAHHWHIHALPAVSSPAGLECGLTVAVDRVGSKHLARLFHAAGPLD